MFTTPPAANGNQPQNAGNNGDKTDDMRNPELPSASRNGQDVAVDTENRENGQGVTSSHEPIH